MARVALLIGVGEYDTAAGLPSLPAAEKDVRSWQQVLENPELGGFDQVTTLLHPTQADMAEAIETWFGGHTKEDLALLFISGHGVKDEESKLYFAASTTRKQGERLIRSTAVAASAVRDFMRQSRAKRQVVILDCCFSGAFGDLLSKDSGLVEFQELLEADSVEAEGRVVMTSSSSIEYSFAPTDGELSIYSRYLLEGIRTGAADQDGDGAITVDELHGFASRKVKEAAPTMTPKIIVLKDEGYRVRISKAPLGDPKVKYRKEAETLAARRQGNLSPVNRRALNVLRQELKLPEDEATQILEEVLQPFREFQAKIQEFEAALKEALEFDPQCGADTLDDLRHLQQVLKLRDEDVEAIATSFNINLTNPPISPAPPDPKIQNPKPKIVQANAPGEAQKSGDDLRSEKGIDYTRLRDLLKAQDWKAADRETYDTMIRAVGKKSGQGFSREELLNFPCADLRTIDGLWVKYSQGRFGFSVQKQIYVECGARLDGSYPGDKIWEKFGDRVGWRKDGNWLLYSDLDPSLYSPQGFFPLVWDFLVLEWVWGWGVVSSLASRLVNCSTSQS
jgi:uncharacterized caspase-like protein